MTRRGYQKANYQAQRAGLFHRLVKNERLSQVEAEDLIARWEREADISGTKSTSARVTVSKMYDASGR